MNTQYPMLPETMAKVFVLIQAGAAGTAAIVSPPIAGDELCWALVGGVVGGTVFLRTLDVVKHTWVERFFTIATSGMIGMFWGPMLANWAASKFAYVAEGPFENIAAGAMIGLLFTPLYALTIATMRAAQTDPAGAISNIRKAWRAIRGKE